MSANWERSGSYIVINYKFHSWYKRLWFWITRRKLTTAGNGDYRFVIPPTELPPGTTFENKVEP